MNLISLIFIESDFWTEKILILEELLLGEDGDMVRDGFFGLFKGLTDD